MITSIKQAKEIAKKYNAIKTDKKRLSFLKEHNSELKVVLDNDCTMVEFNQIEVDTTKELELIQNIELQEFDYYHGWTDGIVELFKFAGITVETC